MKKSKYKSQSLFRKYTVPILSILCVVSWYHVLWQYSIKHWKPKSGVVVTGIQDFQNEEQLAAFLSEDDTLISDQMTASELLTWTPPSANLSFDAQCRPGAWEGAAFIHVPKAAGTFYRDALLRRLGQDTFNTFKFCQIPDSIMYICPKDDELRQRELDYYSTNFLNTCTLISSHNDHSLLDRLTATDPFQNTTTNYYAPPPKNIFKILPVRDPVDLVVSLFLHLTGHYAANVTTTSFPEWLEGQQGNMQTRMLLGDRGCFGTNHRLESMRYDEVVNAIKVRLDSVCAVLVKERPKDSIRVLARVMEWKVSEWSLERLSGTVINQQMKQTDSSQYKTPELVKRIEEKFQYDRVLYDIAVQKFDWLVRVSEEQERILNGIRGGGGVKNGSERQGTGG